MDLKELSLSLSLHERKLLPHLHKEMTLETLIAGSKLSDVEVRRALLWLSNREMVKLDMAHEQVVTLLENGQVAQAHGLSELQVLKGLQQGSQLVSELVTDHLPQPEIMSSIGILKREQAITVEKTDNGMQLSSTENGRVLADAQDNPLQSFLGAHTFPVPLTKLTEQEQGYCKELMRRKDFLKIEIKKTLHVTLLPLGEQMSKADLDFSAVEEQLTTDLITTGGWKGKVFRTYDVESPVPAITAGRRHPYREATHILRDIYLQMGFQEMQGPFVETAFWCMDSMWIPQDHPARDVQDTFFLGQKGELPDRELVARVKRAHEDGLDTGSTGYRKNWDQELAKELILRTHSTATTFRTLAELGNKDGKYFYIANVFRNEAVDATHLAEFLQAEGFVVGDNLTLSDLMGFIKEFYARLGITKIRFKPTYNPYTEPSLEAHYYDEAKGKWYALINSGLFRPESLAPYGIKKTVIAWGMGASRVAALLNHKKNLRELVGPTVDFDWIATHTKPQARLD